jgi:hypothetical protein
VRRNRIILSESLAIVVASAIIAYNFMGGPNNNIIFYIDEWFPFNPLYPIRAQLWAWNWWSGLGTTGGGSLWNFPHYAIIYALHGALGLNYGLSQYVLYVTVMSLSGLGMLIFTRRVYGEEYRDTLAPMASGLLYLASAYETYMYTQFYGEIWLYLTVPWLMLALLSAMQLARNGNLPVAQVSAASLLLYLALPGVQWVWILTFVPFTLAYIVLLYIIFRPRLRYLVFTVTFLGAEFILLNSSLLLSAPGILAGLSSPTSPKTAPWVWVLGNSAAEPYVASIGGVATYYGISTILMSCALAILSYAAILVAKEKGVLRAHVYFLAAASLLATASMSGTQPPFGQVFTYLWWHFPPLRAFQTLVMDFGNLTALAFSVMAPVGLLGIMRRWKRTATVALLILLLAWLSIGVPQLTFGYVTANPSNPGPRVPLSIVNDQVGMAQYILSHQPGDCQLCRAMILPAQGPLLRSHDYFANSIVAFYGVPVLYGTYKPIYDVRVYQGLAQEIYLNETSDVPAQLAALGVRYIIVMTNPAPYWEPFQQNVTVYLRNLAGVPGISLVGSWGSWLLYEDNYTYPMIYASPLPHGYNGSGLVYSFPQVPPILGDTVSYRMVSPVEFDVHVHNATGPFLLVLSTTYGDWKLGGLAARHVLVFGYANGWVINRTGSYNLELYFPYQSQLDLITSMQVVAIVLPVLLLAGLWLKRALARPICDAHGK